MTTALTSSLAKTTARTATRRRRRPEAFTVVSVIGVTCFMLICLVPFWMIVSGSFTDEQTLATSGYSLIPRPFSTTSYELIFTGPTVLSAYTASIFITVVGTAMALAFTSGLSWVIARRLPYVSRPLAVFAYIPMLFTGGLVPLYLLVTQYLKLQNSYFAVILPLLVAPFLVFIQVSAFRQLPEEILDSARVDGAGEMQIFFRIGLPLSKPILAVIGLFYAVHYWNEWFTALLFMSDVHKYPLPLLLQNLISNVSFSQMLPTAAEQSTPVYQLRLALTVVTIGPILLAYPFAQRYFVKGITLGATKG
ncbi:carbohydrate ABC transporter membrane protein 2 (CUT1 family) [Kribbella rubisoli]|uniref:Carbohydrate ABC transporter membrane protein 2 (CUT1 family) n=1 Tax=Kribbella rubisoli TaxID=3075929 RepID=A0A4Q7X050_9ACTN|nr:carbohydrate ABC transporter permease [Kribbella rubisoli]RZU16222.1 carbohydrate ABC transporter membrane protein 2 (CUT1 family) [Kribbella rubisoli]